VNGKADGGKYTTAELADLQKYLETVTDEILSNAWSDDDNVNAEIQNILNSDVANTDGHVAINEVFMFPILKRFSIEFHIQLQQYYLFARIKSVQLLLLLIEIA
jgi:hypothetical protein